MLGLKNQHRLESPPESSLKKTIGSRRFRRDRAVLSTPQKSTCLYRAGRCGNRNCCYDSYDSYDDKKRRKEIPFWWHFMAFFTMFEKFQTRHPTSTWHGTETSENLLRSTVCFLQTSGRCVGLRAYATFSPAHAITLLTAHVTPRGQMQQKQNLK